MGDATSIEWTDATWNPVRGCSRVSPGCEHCYAEGVAARFSGPGLPYEGLARRSSRGLPQWTGEVRLVPEHLADPLRWTRPRRVFVNSMSDLFHEKLADEVIDSVFAVMLLSPRHTFQVLTKRADRMRRYFERLGAYALILRAADRIRAEHPELAQVGISDPRLVPAPWIWLGVSVEDQQRADERIPDLLCTPAAVRFVSYEPALGPVDFSPWVFDREAAIEKAMFGAAAMSQDQADAVIECSLDWVIVGGESGPRARPFDVAWALRVVDQCEAAGVACFVKQLGARPLDVGVPRSLKSRKGNDMSEWPMSIRVREMPKAVRP